MYKIVVLFLIIVPALEIGLFLLSGNVIGIWPTIGLIILTGLVGAWLAKQQGLQILKQAEIRMKRGEIPGESILDGICVLVGGVLLLTPGFITDTLGFLLLIPTTRYTAKAQLRRIIQSLINRGQFFIIR